MQPDGQMGLRPQGGPSFQSYRSCRPPEAICSQSVPIDEVTGHLLTIMSAKAFEREVI
jgi:hypothetical protein